MNNRLIAKLIANWIFKNLRLDYDETWSPDHMDYNDTYDAIIKILSNLD